MKKIKNIIKILSIIMIVLIAIIIIAICTLKANQKGLENETQTPISEIEDSFEETQEISKTEYTVINIVANRYIQAINKNNSTYLELQRAEGEQSKEIEKQIIQEILNLLSDTYIQNNKITNENLQEYISLENEQLSFIPLKIKRLVDENIKTYVVEGLVENIEYKSKGRRCYIINIDYTNKYFSIEPTEKEYDEITHVEKITSISKKDNNEYTINAINAQTKVQDYMDLYKKIVLAEPEIIYQYMDEEYKNKRFGSIEQFVKYVEENKEYTERATLKQYLVENYDNYIEYVGKDQYGNLYIFDEKSILDFSLRLDTYTIPTDNFRETYNSSEDVYKCQMNIDKFFQMINRQDYKTAYNYLAEGYKNNYFKTEEEFTNFAKNTFYTYNEVTFNSYEQKGNRLFVFKIKLNDLTGENTDKKEIRIIMQLDEDLNFEMSFGM